MNWTQIKVGQVWQSKDPRDFGATRTVIEAPTAQMGYVLMDSGCRKTRLRPSTLLTRYRCIRDGGGSE